MGTNMVEEKEILVNWAEMRQLRMKSARKVADVFKLRVLYEGMDYYADLKVIQDFIQIIPDDENIDTRCFFESHFSGAQPIVDEVNKRFQLQFNFKSSTRLPLILIVKNQDILTHLESAVSALFGALTNYDGVDMEEANAPIN